MKNYEYWENPEDHVPQIIAKGEDLTKEAEAIYRGGYFAKADKEDQLYQAHEYNLKRIKSILTWLCIPFTEDSESVSVSRRDSIKANRRIENLGFEDPCYSTSA